MLPSPHSTPASLGLVKGWVRAVYSYPVQCPCWKNPPPASYKCLLCLLHNKVLAYRGHRESFFLPFSFSIKSHLSLELLLLYQPSIFPSFPSFFSPPHVPSVSFHPPLRPCPLSLIFPVHNSFPHQVPHLQFPDFKARRNHSDHSV